MILKDARDLHRPVACGESDYTFYSNNMVDRDSSVGIATDEGWRSANRISVGA